MPSESSGNTIVRCDHCIQLQKDMGRVVTHLQALYAGIGANKVAEIWGSISMAKLAMKDLNDRYPDPSVTDPIQ